MLKRMMSLVLCVVMVISMVPVQAFATEDVTGPAEMVMEPTKETTTPTEAVPESTEETTAPTEPVTESTEETTALTEPATEPTEDTTAPTEEVTQPSDEMIPGDIIFNDVIASESMNSSSIISDNSCGENLTWALSDDGTLTISGTGSMASNSTAPWGDQKELITSIKIEEGVTEISDRAFLNLPNLETVTMADSVTAIGDYAFYGAGNLKTVYLSKALQKIGTAVFYECHSLGEIMIPKTVTDIGDGAFVRCTSLSNVEFEENRNTGLSFGEDTFYECTALQNIVLPEGLSTIGTNAFYGCTALTSVTLPYTLSYIYPPCFGNCKNVVLQVQKFTYAEEYAISNNMAYDWYFAEDTEGILNSDNCSLEIDAANSAETGEVSVSLKYSIDADHWVALEYPKLQIYLSSNRVMKEDSLLYQNKSYTQYEYDIEDGCLKIELTDSEGVISFNLGLDNTGTFSCWTFFSYVSENVDKRLEIMSKSVDINLVTLEAPEDITEEEFNVSGMAPAKSDVTVYLNNVYAGTVTSASNGSYSLRVSLGSPEKSGGYTLRAEALGSDGVVYTAEHFLYYRHNGPQVSEIKFYHDSGSEDYIVLNGADGSVSIDYIDSENPYKFEISIENPESIGYVYVTSTVDGIKKSIDAVYNEDTGTYIAVGYFDTNDKYYSPGSINVEYTLKTSAPPVGNDVDWEELNSYLGDNFKNATVSNTSSGNTDYGTVDFSSTISELEDVVMDYSIATFDSATGTQLEELRNYYKTGMDIVGYIVPGLDDSRYYAYLDFSDPNTLKMLVDDGLDVAGKAIELQLTFTEELTDKYIKLDDISNVLSNAGTIVSTVGEVYNIRQDMDALREEVTASDRVTDKTAAFEAIDELELDQIAFALAVTALPILVSGGVAAPGAATLFSAIIGVMSSVSNVVYDYRISGIKGESVDTDWYSNIDTKTYQVGDNVYFDITEIWHQVSYVVGAYQWEILRSECVVYGTGPMWHRDYRWPFERLRKVIIKPGVTEIGDYFFAANNWLESIEIPNTVEYIGGHAFFGCTTLKTVVLPNSLKEIGGSAFSQCDALIQIDIPDSVEMIDGAAFAYCDNLSIVNLGDGITSIGRYAFEKCENLKEIDLPDSLIFLGEGVFAFSGLEELTLTGNLKDCEGSDFLYESNISIVRFKSGTKTIPYRILNYAQNVEEVYMPSSVTQIDGSAFAYCSSLRKVIFSPNTEIIETCAFLNCKSLEDVRLPDELLIIESNVFEGCTALSNVEFSNSLVEIGAYAFERCVNLKSIDLPDSLKTIYEDAFWNSAIEEIHLPRNVETVLFEAIPDEDGTIYLNDYGNAFAGMFSLKNITVDIENPYLSSKNGVLFNNDGTVLIAYPGNRIENYTIPDGVEKIACYAFSRSFTEKNTIIIPQSVKTIQPYIFKSGRFNRDEVGIDDEWRNVTLYFKGLPPSVSNFTFCEINADIYYPSNLTEWESFGTIVGDYYWDANLTWLGYILDNVETERKVYTIEELYEALSMSKDYSRVIIIVCNDLILSEDCIIPENVVINIGYGSSLEISRGAVLNNNGTVNAYRETCLIINGTWSGNNPVYAKALAYGTFGENLSWVFYEDGILSIEGSGAMPDFSFDGTDIPWSDYQNQITSVTIGEGITYLGEYTFQLSNLVAISLPATLAGIGRMAMVYNHVLKEIKVSQGSKTYASLDGVLYDQAMTTVIQYPIGKSAENLTIPDTVVELDSYSLAYHNELTEISIPDGIIRIQSDALFNCYNLKTVVIPASVSYIGNSAFGACDNLEKITVAESNPYLCVIDNVFFDKEMTTLVQYSDYQTNSYIVPEGIKHIGDEAFNGCWELSEVKLPESLETIGWFSFGSCDNLTRITIPSSVTEIDMYALAFSGLSEVYFDGNAPTIQDFAFYGINATVYYPVNCSGWTVDIMQDYGGTITWVSYGVARNRVTIDSEAINGQKSVWIDGVEYAVQVDGDSCYVDLPDGNAKTMVSYTWHVDDVSDIHTQYPVSMKVWTLSNEDGLYTATRVEELDNILQYSGASIRVTGKKGIRMITSMNQAKKNDLISDGLAGYTLKEYGTVVAWASQLGNKSLVLDNSYAKSNYAYKKDVADPVFAYAGDLMQYTNVLVGFTTSQCKNDLVMRPYMILEDTDGSEMTIYGGTVTRSIGYIAYQNRNAFTAGTDAYKYVWDIIHSVYGDAYDAEYVA